MAGITKRILPPIVWICIYPISILPWWIHYSYAYIGYIIAYYITGYRRDVIAINLSRSFPKLNYNQIRDLHQEYLKYLFNIFSEWVKLNTISKKKLKEKLTIENHQILDQFAEEGKSTFVVMGHLGNWEYMNILPQYINTPIYVGYKKQRGCISNFLSIKMRTRFNINIIESSEILRYILSNKNKPQIYIFIADQSPHWSNTKRYNFLNQPTTAFDGVEKLAKNTNTKLVYLDIILTKKGSYTMSFKEFNNNSELSNTQDFLYKLEESIYKAPHTWLWSHKRWKH